MEEMVRFECSYFVPLNGLAVLLMNSTEPVFLEYNVRCEYLHSKKMMVGSRVVSFFLVFFQYGCIYWSHG